jgi:hypothetical protein
MTGLMPELVVRGLVLAVVVSALGGRTVLAIASGHETQFAISVAMLVVFTVAALLWPPPPRRWVLWMPRPLALLIVGASSAGLCALLWSLHQRLLSFAGT